MSRFNFEGFDFKKVFKDDEQEILNIIKVAFSTIATVLVALPFFTHVALAAVLGSILGLVIGIVSKGICNAVHFYINK